MLLIRKATQKDLLLIQKLNNQLFELELATFDKYLIKDWPLTKQGREYFENSINEDYVIVAELNHKVVGYLLGECADKSYYPFKIAELCNMCIDKDYRKQGIGNFLFHQFENDFKAKGINHFIVTASFKNENAIAFYKKMGFESTNITLAKF